MLTTNVMILCTHNSARSVLAEAMLNHLARAAGKNVQAFSAGSSPSGRVNPLALEVLQRSGVAIAGLHSKSWDHFAAATSPSMRVVITVCDSAANEVCPIWPGAPVKTHWGYADPSLVVGTDAQRLQAFDLTRQAIAYRLMQFLQLPLADLNNPQLQQALAAIGRS